MGPAIDDARDGGTISYGAGSHLGTWAGDSSTSPEGLPDSTGRSAPCRAGTAPCPTAALALLRGSGRGAPGPHWHHCIVASLHCNSLRCNELQAGVRATMQRCHPGHGPPLGRKARGSKRAPRAARSCRRLRPACLQLYQRGGTPLSAAYPRRPLPGAAGSRRRAGRARSVGRWGAMSARVVPEEVGNLARHERSKSFERWDLRRVTAACRARRSWQTGGAAGAVSQARVGRRRDLGRRPGAGGGERRALPRPPRA
jgi:hypothetical protein